MPKLCTRSVCLFGFVQVGFPSCGLAIECKNSFPRTAYGCAQGCWDNVPFDEPRELDPNDWDVMSLRTRTKCLVPAHYSISGTRLTEHLFPLCFIGSC